MTFDADPAPRGPRPVLSRRRRGPLLPTIALLVTAVVAFLIFASVWTDVLWFRQLGYSEVFRTRLVTRFVLFALGAAVMAGAVVTSLLVGYRSRPVYAPVSVELASLDRYREAMEPARRVVTVVVPALLALFAGSAASGQWQTAQLWLHRQSFGQRDAQFHRDVGFYVFTLPWLQWLTTFLTTVVFIAGLVALATHYLYGGLRLQGGAGPRVTAAARVHLSVLAAAFLVLRAISYWLGRYALTTKDSTRITGLTYTDATAVLTARGVLAAIATIVALLFVASALTDRWRSIPLFGVALLVVSAILVGGIYPAAVQKFQVTPNANSYERAYIQRNIDATRAAYGLSNVKVVPYRAETQAQPENLRRDAAAVPGIRLVDPLLVSETFRQLQQNKQFYAFPDALDVDRYTVDNRQRDAIVAVREVNLAAVPAQDRNWVNDHLVYTHGYGVVAAYGNEQGADGKPVFFTQGTRSEGGEFGSYEPRVYFGENSPEYSIVGAPSGRPPLELDFPTETGTRNTVYGGTGGISLSNGFTRLLYAMKFREQNILLSDQVTSKSRIMYDRNPRDRVAKVAPFLTLDGNPYPAVVDGRVTWIVDGYTTTARFPYSSTQVLEEATSDSLTASSQSVVALQAKRINYIRNSVKATVDAYDGSVKLYAWDDKDPLLKAWSKIFPGMFRPLSSMSGQLMDHVRYPEDLFKVQRALLRRYHVTDAPTFFGAQDVWRVPADPTHTRLDQLQPPYYLTLQMPEQEAPTFSLSSSYIPVSGGRDVLTGFLAVDSDAGAEPGRRREDYGAMRLLELPRDTVVAGPNQMSNTFYADATVSSALNLLRNGGSSVQSGNLLTLPLGGGLLYVQPVYVRGAGQSSYPLLQKVLVGFGDKIGFANTLDEALDQVFNNKGTGTGSGDGSGGDGKGTGSDGKGGPAQDDPRTRLEAALREASAALKDSDAALKKGDFAAYGVAQKRLQDAVARALVAEADLGKASGVKVEVTASPSPTGASPSPTSTGAAVSNATPGATATASPSPTRTGSP